MIVQLVSLTIFIEQNTSAMEQGVLIADKVYISDNLHGYKDIHTYIKDDLLYKIKKLSSRRILA